MFKVNNKDTRTYSSVSVFNFEQVNASWVTKTSQLYSADTNRPATQHKKKLKSIKFLDFKWKS